MKQTWLLRINGRQVAQFPQDENEMVTYWAVPPGALRDGDNELRIDCTGGPSDDVLVGEIAILDAPRAKVMSEATVEVNVTGADGGTPLPCRITVADERGALVDLGNRSDAHMAVRPGVVYASDGQATLSLPAGRYTIYAGRGFAYSIDSTALDLRPGGIVKKSLRIRKAVPLDGYVSCDTHIHTFTYSRHGDATIEERMITLAGEGIELPIATDHNLQIDYDAPARAMHVRKFFTPVIGNEVTTASLGHFCVFPFVKGAHLVNWRVHSWAALSRDITNIAGNPVIILNHARDLHGNFRPFDPSRHVSLTGKDLDGWTLPANAMEVTNSGAVQTDPMQLYRDWFGMLNRGYALTPVGASDSHDVSRYIVGQGRTYIRCDHSDPGDIDVAQAIRALREGRVLVSYGLLAELVVAGKYGPGDVVPASGDLDVRVRVLGPEWTRATHVALFANGIKMREADIATPAGKPEPAGIKWEGHWVLPRPKHDEFLVAIATGPGIGKPYWPTAKPYQPTSPQFSGYVLGSTGPVWIDVKGSGEFRSAYQYATDVVNATNGDLAAVVARLADDDEATAAQAACLLRARDPRDFERRAHDATRSAAPAVRRGFDMFLAEWAKTRSAKSTPRP